MFFLALASLMVIWGNTVLVTSLQGAGFVVYWAACFTFAMTSSVIAMLDVRAILRNIRDESAASFQRAMRDIEHAPETSEEPATVSVYARRSRPLEAAR